MLDAYQQKESNDCEWEMRAKKADVLLHRWPKGGPGAGAPKKFEDFDKLIFASVPLIILQFRL